MPALSPFGLAVTAGGHVKLDLVLQLEGLPAGRHVAWASGPMLEPMVRLGEVKNGETTLGPITLDRFIIFVTAELDSAPSRLGTLVLRGMSPSSVLLPHLTVPAPAT